MLISQNGKENIIYHMYLAKGLWTPRRDGSGPRLPIDRMPFGLDLLLIMLREKNLQNHKLFQCHFSRTIYSVCVLAKTTALSSIRFFDHIGPCSVLVLVVLPLIT